MSVQKERRAGGPRVPLHTLVEIGAGEGGSAAFEAESINVTTAGMQLKTAYLPEIGEPLICRFEGSGTEIVVQGEVAWRNEDSYGGDFGVRFLEMDQDSLDGLRDIVGDPIAEQEEVQEAQGPVAAKIGRGTRVRLHIEGLGSPMKARVREGTSGEVMVGSNLEFLRVGRSVELENVDAEVNRPARIERVSVEVEPTSHVPQLIVALRYLDVADDVPATMTTAYADDESDEPTAMQDDEDGQEDAYADRAREDDGFDEQDDDECEDDEEQAGEGRAAVVWSKVKQVGPKFAVVGSFARRWGSKAKDAMGDAVTVAKKKAAEKVREHQEAKAPRRTTAPPPKGALRGDGTRTGRKSVPMEEPDAPKASKGKKAIPKRAAMIALVAVLLTVVGIGFAKNAFTGSEDETAKAEESSETMPAGALPGAEGAEDSSDPPIVPGAMGVGAPNAGAGLVANVPLFGPTPMSTAAPMAPMAAIPAPAVAAATPPPGDSGEGAENADSATDEGEDTDMGAMAAAVEDEGEGEGSDDESAAEPEDKPAAKPSKKSKKATAVSSFGRGRVNDPVVLTLNMNHKIKELRGVRRGDGFSVDVVGARSKEPAGGLRRQDKRIAAAKVVNRGSNSQLTIRFNGTVPDYRVQASGSTLRILIDGDKKTASSNASGRGKKRR